MRTVSLTFAKFNEATIDQLIEKYSDSTECAIDHSTKEDKGDKVNYKIQFTSEAGIYSFAYHWGVIQGSTNTNASFHLLKI